MRKCIVALILCLVSVTMMSQERIGSYSMSFYDGKTFDILATEPSNGKYSIYFEVKGKYKSDDVKLCVESRELAEFKSTLIQIRDKFLEWEKTAKDNKVSGINKEFPFRLPKMSVAWYGTKWWFSFNKRFTPIFFVFSDGTCAMVVHEKVTASSNEYIDQEFYWVLQTESEFNEIINNLDENVVINYFNNKGNAQDLFQ